MWPKLFFFEKAPKGKKNFSNYHILPQMEGLVPGARESSPTILCHPLAFLVIPDHSLSSPTRSGIFSLSFRLSGEFSVIFPPKSTSRAQICRFLRTAPSISDFP